MQNRKHAMLKILQSSNTAKSSEELAAVLQVSSRTIKSYVKECNEQYGDVLIKSSKNGYTIDKFLKQDEIEKVIPLEGASRINTIMKELMQSSTTSKFVYDLCDKLGISESTLKKEIREFNNKITLLDVSLKIKDGILFVDGDESNKRKMIGGILREETKLKFLDFSTIQISFKNLSVTQLVFIVKDVFRKYKQYLHEFALFNIVLHLCISIERIKHGNSITSDTSLVGMTNKQSELLEELCTKISKEFQIDINEEEKVQIGILVQGNSTQTLQDTTSIMASYVDLDILDFAKEIITGIHKLYFINLDTTSFFPQFSIHLQNLLVRAKNMQHIANPLTENIKLTCPLIFDIASFVAVEIRHKYGFRIHEDEITFIALHIGAEIERQEVKNRKIRCALICPKYLDIQENMVNDLMFRFQSYIVITAVHEKEDVCMDTIEFLITTIPLQKTYEVPTVQVTQIFTEDASSNLLRQLQEVQLRKKNEYLRENIHKLFSKDLFFREPMKGNRFQLIRFLSKKLSDLMYVNGDYVEEVVNRERAASTVFHNVAIPHSTLMNANKTSISVCLFPKGYKWGSRKVKIVLLIAINESDKQNFKDLYDSIVTLFSSQKAIDMLIEVKDFGDFQTEVYKLLEA